MKKILIFTAIAFAGVPGFSQSTKTQVTSKNSWLKLGVIAGLPVDNSSTKSNFVAGIDLKAQLMVTRHLGLGVTGGYNQFFPKNNQQNFGIIPLGGIVRIYPAKRGIYAGVDAGVAVVTGITNAKSGLYARPQAGYHNYSWNIFGFYNHVFRGVADGGKIQYAGIGCTYNLRFN